MNVLNEREGGHEVKIRALQKPKHAAPSNSIHGVSELRCGAKGWRTRFLLWLKKTHCDEPFHGACEVLGLKPFRTQTTRAAKQ